MKITLTLYRNLTFKSYNWIMLPIFEMSGYTFPIAKGNTWKGKNEIKFIFYLWKLNTFTYILDKFCCFSVFVMSTSNKYQTSVSKNVKQLSFVAIIIALLKLEHLGLTRARELKSCIVIDFGMGNLKITLKIYRNEIFQSYNWILLSYLWNAGIVFPVATVSKW